MFVIILCAAGCAEKDVPLVLENEIENSSDSSDDSDNDSNDSLESQQNEEDNIPVEKVIEKTLGLVVDGYIHFPDGYKEKQYTEAEMFDLLENDRQTVWWQNVKPELYDAKMALEAAILEKGWRIRYTSAYRPQQYQSHLFDIITKLYDTSMLSAEEKKYYEDEKVKHNLGTLVLADSPHTHGTSFDAIVYDENGKALNGMQFKDERLEVLLRDLRDKSISLWLVFEKDYVHFDLW